MITASGIVMMSGDDTLRMISSHTYAQIEKNAVVRKTGICAIERDSPGGRQTMHTAEMTIKLKAAEPTMVEGPSSPEW